MLNHCSKRFTQTSLHIQWAISDIPPNDCFRSDVMIPGFKGTERHQVAALVRSLWAKWRKGSKLAEFLGGNGGALCSELFEVQWLKEAQHNCTRATNLQYNIVPSLRAFAALSK